MKKIIAILLVTMILMSGMSAFAASTATSVYNESKSDAKDQYFTTYGTIENGGNGFVTLLVTTDGTISIDNIMYIDQTNADENGNFSFTDYIPKINVPVGQKYVVKVGATNLPQAISGGYLEAPEITGHKVTGAVTFQGEHTGVAIEFRKDGQVFNSMSITADGAFSMDSVPDGEYQIVVTKPAYLPALATVTVNGGNLTVPKIKLLAGDLVPEDNIIAINDLSEVIAYYGAEKGDGRYKPEYDINDDNIINIDELSEIIANYGAENPLFKSADE